MGSPETLRTFLDELEKLGTAPAPPEKGDAKQKLRRAGMIGAGVLGAGLGAYYGLPGVIQGTAGGLRTVGRAMRSPAGARDVMRRGWQSMEGTSPQFAQEAQESIGKKTLLGLGRRRTVADVERRHGHLVTPTGGGKFTPRESVGLGEALEGGGARGVAEELSRRGWTGRGPVTKYTPLGMKSVTIGFPLAFAGSDLKKGDPEFTGQGRAERVGKSVGETAGLIAGWPLGAAAGAGAGAMAAKSPALAKWLGRGKKGVLPMLAGTMVTGAAGSALGRAVGRPIDIATGERQEAQARKGLKKYLEHRQRQVAREQQGSGAY